MICKDIITKEDMALYLKWAVADSSDTKNLASFFDLVTESNRSKMFEKQTEMLFLLYNEFLSIERIADVDSIISESDVGGVMHVLSLPYRYSREKKVRDYIVNLKNSDYGNEILMESQFAALDASFTAAEKTMLKSHSFVSSLKSGEESYSKFFCRINGVKAPIESKCGTESGSMTILYDSASESKMDPIALASYILNEGSESGLLLSVLKKIGSGTIN